MSNYFKNKKDNYNSNTSQERELTFLEKVCRVLAAKYNPYRNGIPGNAHKFKSGLKKKKKKRR